MNITSTRNRPSIQPQKPANPPQQSSDSQEPKESYSAWTPFANAGVVGAAVAVPAAVGALATSVFPNAGTLAKGAMVVGASAALGLGAGLWAVKGAKEEFNGHPVLTAISGVVAGRCRCGSRGSGSHFRGRYSPGPKRRGLGTRPTFRTSSKSRRPEANFRGVAPQQCAPAHKFRTLLSNTRTRVPGLETPSSERSMDRRPWGFRLANPHPQLGKSR